MVTCPGIIHSGVQVITKPETDQISSKPCTSFSPEDPHTLKPVSESLRLFKIDVFLGTLSKEISVRLEWGPSMGILGEHQGSGWWSCFAISRDMHSVSSFVERHGCECLRFLGQPVIDFTGPCSTKRSILISSRELKGDPQSYRLCLITEHHSLDSIQNLF